MRPARRPIHHRLLRVVDIGSSPPLRRVLGLRDLVLFFVTTGTNLQWVALAAAAGPSALPVWAAGAAAMFVPLSVCVVDLSSRYPQEGGLYVWTRRAFGPFAGFMTGWTYWTSNLPYFPGLLYFTAGNALIALGAAGAPLTASPAYFITAALAGLALATVLNVRGLHVGKWLNNVGAVTRWLATLLLIGLGTLALVRLGPATSFSASALLPGLGVRDLVFFSAIAFAWTGPEAASFMGDEIQQPRRTLPRALALAAPMIAAIYVLGTLSVLVAVPAAEVSGLQGIMQAVARAEERLGLSGVVPLAAALMTVTCLGSVGAWLEAVARLPLVAGLDRHLPPAFSRLHPRWGSPHVALLTQAAVAAVFVFLGQAGTTVKGAYEVLVSTTFIVTFVPFVLVFAAAIRLQGTPRPPEAVRIPGGAGTVRALAAVGLVTTLVSIGLALLPAPDEPRKLLAVGKVVGLSLALVLAGVAVYVRGRAAAAAVAAERA
ncbi:MAG TPA: APC family permease [Vicinamibacteria bacterium]|nr:APC family permease [Vicinamibacteria bacterium]